MSMLEFIDRHADGLALLAILLVWTIAHYCVPRRAK